MKNDYTLVFCPLSTGNNQRARQPINNGALAVGAGRRLLGLSILSAMTLTLTGRLASRPLKCDWEKTRANILDKMVLEYHRIYYYTMAAATIPTPAQIA
jgi:hypothetical protein